MCLPLIKKFTRKLWDVCLNRNLPKALVAGRGCLREVIVIPFGNYKNMYIFI